jgi:Gas vesicle synthesis protein GvpO
MLEAEPAALEEDELLDADEPEEADDEIPDADEPEAADEDEMFDADEPEAADQDESVADGQRRRPARRSRKAMTAGEAAKAALREIAALTAKQPEGVTEVERTEDGWTVGIELVEDQRIPSSSDILATYETTIDADGELLSYRRVRRYARGRGDTEES